MYNVSKEQFNLRPGIYTSTKKALYCLCRESNTTVYLYFINFKEKFDEV